MLKEWYSQD